MKSFTFLILLLFNFTCYGQSSIGDIIQKMNKASVNLHTAKFTIYGEERLRNGELLVSERIVKLNVNPQKVYFYSVKPDPGMEVLWKNGINEKMLVNPGGFPYITLNISHTGSVARKDSHHSIQDMGFEYVVNLMNYYVRTQGDNILKWAFIQDTVQWQGRSCIHLVIDFKNYKPYTYTVLQGENVSSIAAKLHVNDYMIFNMNPTVDDMDDVKPGQKITVPNFYASKIEFFIDRTTWLPVKQLIYDQKGLYEKYEFRNLVVNPVFKSDEFSSDYKDYKF